MNKKQKLLLISIILLTATFFRFYRIYQTAPFLGDQGRDLIEIRESLLAGRIPLRGPLSNLGVHAGPVYYYLLIPSLLLTNYHPIGPTIFITFLGVINSLLIYQIGNKLFRRFPSLLAAMLYASSPIVIQRTRGIWNPAPLSFFVLLILFSFLQIQEKKLLNWLVFLGLFSGIAIQLYPPAYFLFIPVLSWWLYLVFKERKKKNLLLFLKWSLAGLTVFLLCLFPFFLFQIQNQFIDARNLLLIFLEKLSATTQPKVDSSIFNSFFTLLGQQFKPFTLNRSIILNTILGIVIITLPFFYKRKSAMFWHSFLSLWLLGNILILVLLLSIIYPHYASPIWPLPFLLLASLISYLPKLPQKILYALGIFLIFLNFKTYFEAPPANDLYRAETTASFIMKKAENKSLSLALISRDSPSDSHIRYFLNLKGAKIKSTNDQASDLLFLVCLQHGCPTTEAIPKLEIVDSECLPVCPPAEERKIINFKNWQFISEEKLFEGQVYLFRSLP